MPEHNLFRIFTNRLNKFGIRYIVTGAVASERGQANNTCYRVIKAEEALVGKAIHEETGEEAGAAAVSDTKPLSHNGYMVQIAKTLVQRTILACK